MKDGKFTVEDLVCWQGYESEHLVDILNKEYDLVAAIEDLQSLIGSKYDPRVEEGRL